MEIARKNALNILQTFPISMDVMWEFVDGHDSSKDQLGQWWNKEAKTPGRTHGPFRKALLNPPRTWSIKVLCYAISNYAALRTTQITRKALRQLSNIPIVLQMESAMYAQLIQQLCENYAILLKDGAHPFVAKLQALVEPVKSKSGAMPDVTTEPISGEDEEGKHDVALMEPMLLEDKKDEELLELDVIDELISSLKPVWDQWMVFGINLKLKDQALKAIEANEPTMEKRFQIMLSFLIGTISKLDIFQALKSQKLVADFAEEWAMRYMTSTAPIVETEAMPHSQESTLIPGDLVPLYRYWNPKLRNHFYTVNPLARVGTVVPGEGGVLRGGAVPGEDVDSGEGHYQCEGIECFIYKTNPMSFGIPAQPLNYYYCAAVNDHYYTTSNDGTICMDGLDYVRGDIVGYCPTNFSADGYTGVTLHEYWNSQAKDHFYTINQGDLGGQRQDNPRYIHQQGVCRVLVSKEQ